MKIQSIAIALLVAISSPSYSAFQEREYNTWYQKDAVLYDITQTSEGLPVMISISQPGDQPICWYPICPMAVVEIRRSCLM
jgi:hypothetical protein